MRIRHQCSSHRDGQFQTLVHLVLASGSHPNLRNPEKHSNFSELHMLRLNHLFWHQFQSQLLPYSIRQKPQDFFTCSNSHTPHLLPLSYGAWIQVFPKSTQPPCPRKKPSVAKTCLFNLFFIFNKFPAHPRNHSWQVIKNKLYPLWVNQTVTRIIENKKPGNFVSGFHYLGWIIIKEEKHEARHNPMYPGCLWIKFILACYFV